MRRSLGSVGCRPRADGHGLRPATRWAGTVNQRRIGGSSRDGIDQGAPRTDPLRNRSRTSYSDAHDCRGKSPLPALSHRSRQHLDHSPGWSAALIAVAVGGGSASTSAGGAGCIHPDRSHRARAYACTPCVGGEAAPSRRPPTSHGGGTAPGDGACPARTKACCRVAGTQCRGAAGAPGGRSCPGTARTERRCPSVARSRACARRLWLRA